MSSFKTYCAPLLERSAPLTAISFGTRAAGTKLKVTEGVPAWATLALTPLDPYPIPTFAVTSSDPAVAIAAIDSNHCLVILGNKPGSATVTVKSGALTATLDVEVKPPLAKSAISFPVLTSVKATGITLTDATKTLSPELQFDLGAFIVPSTHNAGSLKWTSSDPRVAIIADVSGIEGNTGVNRVGHITTIRAIAPGTATISGTIDGVTASCAVTVI